MTTAVEIIGVRKLFGATTALERVDFEVGAGEFVSLLGASGCGKSTLLRIIAGFESPSEGRVRIHGEDVTRLPPERRPTNLVFQRGALFPHMTVRENVGYGLKVKGWARTRIDARVEEMLALVRLEGFGDREPGQLSGGQAQRVALARALASEPQVLLLDEPLSALDLKLRQQMQLELRAIQKHLGATFVFVTHDQTEALVMSDRIAVMDRGRVVQVGSPREIYTRPTSLFVSDFIGQTNFLRGTVIASGGGAATLRTDDGQTLLGESTADLSPGSAATLSLRPEAIRLLRAAEAGEGQGLRGTIAEVIYLGGSVRAGVAGGDALVWVELRDDKAEGLVPGEPVVMTWKPSAATVWPGNAAPLARAGSTR